MYHDKPKRGVLGQFRPSRHYTEQTSDTLVLHPFDITTDFLTAIYRDKGWDVIIDPFIEPTMVAELIKSHTRIVCLGHGSPDGLQGRHGLIINSTLAPLLRTKKLVCIWCNANLFIQEHGLKGFYSGMFLSQTDECDLFNVSYKDELQIESSNTLFASTLAKHIDSGNILESVKREYRADDDPVITFNRNRLYSNIGGLELIDPQIDEIISTIQLHQNYVDLYSDILDFGEESSAKLAFSEDETEINQNNSSGDMDEKYISYCQEELEHHSNELERMKEKFREAMEESGKGWRF